MTASHAASEEVLERLYQTILARRGTDPASSYTAKLFSQGSAKIAQKLGEEVIEAVIELVRGNSGELVKESADLLYHLMVAWAEAGVKPEQVWTELRRREGVGGLTEKAARLKT